MRYLCISERCFPDAPGGSARVAWDVAQLMRDRGHEVTLFCKRQPASEYPEGARLQDGIRIVRYDESSVPRWHPGRLHQITKSASVAAKRWLADEKWDLVHIHSPVIGRGVMDALGSGPRYVLTVHSPILLEQQVNWRQDKWTGKFKLLTAQPLLRRLERGLIEDSDRIHALSAFTRDELVKFHGMAEKITVIPHWCLERHESSMDKAAARRALGWPLDKTIFFSVRQLRARYGLDVAIRAVASMPRKEETLYFIAGAGYLRAVLEKLVRDTGVEGIVRLVGRISDSDLQLAYQAADAFVLPTRELECFGLIILEALSHGCPLVATDAGAIPEILGPVMSDAIVPAGDVGQLAGKLNSIVDRNLVFPGADELKTAVRGVYGANRIVPRHLSLLES